MNDSFFGFHDPHQYSKQSVDHSVDDRYFSLFNVASGAWHVIHAVAALGKYDTLLEIFEVFRDRFVCPKCRLHIGKFMKSKYYPPSKKMSNIDLFIWTVNFHNMVNIRLEKRIFTPAGARRLFNHIVVRRRGKTSSSVEEFRERFISHENLKKIKLEFTLPDLDVTGVYGGRNRGEDFGSLSISNEYKIENIMYVPYLLAANGMLASSKIILDDVIMLDGSDHAYCLVEKFVAVSDPLGAITLLLEITGEEEFYSAGKILFELTTLADMDGKNHKSIVGDESAMIAQQKLRDVTLRTRVDYIEF